MWGSNRHFGIGSCLLMLLTACSSDSASGPDQHNTLPLPEEFSAWAGAVIGEQAPGTHPELNTAALEGCPYISPDGKTLFMASNRPGGLGGIDIWMSTRTTATGPWGQPVNAGAVVNSAQNDFCPTLGPDGHAFFFVSNRPGGCGGDDIYTTRRRDDGSFEEPTRLDCQVNSAGNEAGPFMLVGTTTVLYFSSTRAGGFAPDAPDATTGDADIYSSDVRGGAFTPAVLVPDVNSAANDLQPNLRRDGLEIYFASNRSGTPGTLGTLGGVDLFTATRAAAAQPWTTPLNLGASVNSAAGDETRPSLSWDATTLYFGSNRPGVEGASDIFVTTRQRITRASR
jgi:hypothetical protein